MFLLVCVDSELPPLNPTALSVLVADRTVEQIVRCYVVKNMYPLQWPFHSLFLSHDRDPYKRVGRLCHCLVSPCDYNDSVAMKAPASIEALKSQREAIVAAAIVIKPTNIPAVDTTGDRKVNRCYRQQ